MNKGWETQIWVSNGQERVPHSILGAVQQNNNIVDASHIPTEQFMQKLETQGGYSGNTQPTIIPEEPITKALKVQV